jgi:glyoxylase-like metal-dependent hydrolase (beta-lactamase superfamily II)
MKNQLKVRTFYGKTASVNSYIFSNDKSQIVLDVLRSSQEAEELAEEIKRANLPLTHILISHGHPDHYLGMDVLVKRFPDVKIIVAHEAIKKDIIGFSNWMESVGWLENEPNLKPKNSDNANGFDYENRIEVLNSETFTLDGGGTLELDTAYNPAEAEHLTTIYSEDLNAFFSSDFCYNGVHLWLGAGVEKKHIVNWKNQLSAFSQKYSALGTTVYPGHGKASDSRLFNEVIQYIESFEKVIVDSKSKDEASQKMKELYPTWEQADFLLHHSVDYQVKE